MRKRLRRALLLMIVSVCFLVAGGTPSYGAGMIYNSDGLSFSGMIESSPLPDNVVMTGYPTTNTFSGVVFDGQHVWLTPAWRTRVVKIDKDTGEMTTYSGWPDGVDSNPNSDDFAGAVFDGKYIWLIPLGVDHVIRIDKDTGEMEAFGNWPEGFNASASNKFAGGTFDGRYIWMARHSSNRVIKFDTQTGEMSGYSNWPPGSNLADHGNRFFTGAVFDGHDVWLVPFDANQLVRVDTTDGSMSGYAHAELIKGNFDYAGGVFDGHNIWLVPFVGSRLAKFDPNSQSFEAYSFPGNKAFNEMFWGGVFDGRNIWLIPAYNTQRLVKFDTHTKEMAEYTDWPDGVASRHFVGGVFDGEKIWLAPWGARQIVKIAPPVTVTFVSNGGSAVEPRIIGLKDKLERPEDPKRTGYTLTGWYTDSALTTLFDFDTPVVEDLTLYAGWEVATYTLEYITDGNGTIAGEATQTVEHGKDGSPVKAVPNVGYHFVRWSDGVETDERVDTNITEDLHVTAEFAINTYTLEYTAGAHSTLTGETTQTVEHGKDGSPVTAVPDEGYHFVRWSDGVEDAVRTDTNVTGNVSVTAEFEINTYTILFESNRGTPVDRQTVRHGDLASEPNRPRRSGHSFVGWYADPELTTLFDFNTPITEDTTLYARWRRVSDRVPEPKAVIVLINGSEETHPTSTATVNGRAVTTVSFDQERLFEQLDAAGQQAVISVIARAGGENVTVELSHHTLEVLAASQTVIELHTEQAIYVVPTALIELDSLMQQLGNNLDPQEVAIHIELAVPSKEMIRVVSDAAGRDSFQIVVEPISFSVKATHGDVTVEATQFLAFVERIIYLPEDVDPRTVTTAIVVEPDGTVRHVPTRITQIDGKYVAVISSMTNSTYALISKASNFRDVNDHWAQAAVEDMGSRLIVHGDDIGMFYPDQAITRAEFAAIVVRALGLKPGDTPADFTDVATSDWFSSVVGTAYSHQLISGFADGTFRPGETITREQAMVMIARAMELTGLLDKRTPHSVEETLQQFLDEDQVSNWARSSVAACIDAGIVTGRTGNWLAPEEYITRAEATVIVQRLLQQSGLIIPVE